MENILPVITLYQPWATWIMRGWKTIETRTHTRFISLVGKTVLIHAGQTTDAEAENNPFLTKDQIMFYPDEMVNGFILGSVFISGFMALNESHEKKALIECTSIKRFGLQIKDIKVFKHPLPVKGGMGIWYYDLEAKQKVKKATSQPREGLKLF